MGTQLGPALLRPRLPTEPFPPVPWAENILDELAKEPAIGYLPDSAPAAEPIAIAALAFLAHGRLDDARRAAAVLATMQIAGTGNVGVRAGETPSWPTSLAVVAWRAMERTETLPVSEPVSRAIDWLLAHRGKAIERSGDFGHNSELVGWAYAENTHSWVEPTAMAVMALGAAGQLEHAATQEGIAVLLDRQLPGGGYNYGNTYVLGQLIRPHIQPTGIALLALAAARQEKVRIYRSIAWLRRSISATTTPVSLAWALLGLRAQDDEVPQGADWLAAAASRVQSRDRSPHKLALLVLAAKGWPT